MKKFEVKGTFKQKNKEQKFTKQVLAKNEELAKEKIFSLIGGKQNIIRKNINIIEIKGVEKNESN